MVEEEVKPGTFAIAAMETARLAKVAVAAQAESLGSSASVLGDLNEVRMAFYYYYYYYY